MLSQENYDKNINNVLDYFNKNYKEPRDCFSDRLDKIKYYTTKYFVNLPQDINKQLDEILKHEINKNPIFDADKITSQIYVHKGDITQIKADAIVNAANADGLGCFEYSHKCIDNVIHSKAGPGLRLECNIVLSGSKIATSDAIITDGYNLQAKYIIHVVGPIYNKNRHKECCTELSYSYSNCLKLADNNNLDSIVFCCISTGIYGFPQEIASQIAIMAVKNYLQTSGSKIKVIFCTYSDTDYEFYR